MRRIYVVRHGITVANTNMTIQGAEDELTEAGVLQAHELGKRLAKIPFDTLISSDFIRARQTAEIVASHTKHSLSLTPLFRETWYPSSLEGLSQQDPKMTEFRALQRTKADDFDWKFENEESAHERRTRARDAFAYAVAQEGDVVVVSHGKFLKHVLFHVVFGDTLLPSVEEHAMRRMLSVNTAITVFQEQPHGNWWNLVAWNDHAHLG